MVDRIEDILSRIKEATANTEVQERLHTQAQIINDYIKGNQWQQIHPINGNIVEIPYDERNPKERTIDNFFYPLWRTYKSILLRTMPRFKAEPVGKDVMDEVGTEIAEIIVDYNHRTLILGEGQDEMGASRLSRMINILLSYGAVILHPYFDPFKKELDVRFISPDQIFVYPPGITEWRDALGIVWERVVPIEVIKRQYPDLDLSTSNIPQHLQMKYDTANKNLCVVKDYYERPYLNEKGLFIRTVNNIVVEDNYIEKYPYENGKLPFFICRENDVIDDLFGVPTLYLIVNRQLDHNKMESLITELAKRLPILLVRHDSKIDPKELVDTTRRVLEYLGEGGAPQYTAPPPVSAALLNRNLTIPQRAEHTLGLHQVILRAETIGSLQSGVAIQSLQEQDMARIYPLTENIIRCYEAFHSFCYDVMREKYSTKKIKEILGEKGELYYTAFKEIELRPMNFRIMGGFSPESKVIEQQQAIQAAQYGAINFTNEREIRAFLKLTVPKIADEFTNEMKEEQLAHLENQRLLRGEKVVPGKYDKDEIHIEVIDEIIKHPLFSKLPEPIQLGFMAHRRVHEDKILDKLNKMAEMSQRLQAPPTPQPTMAEKIGGA